MITASLIVALLKRPNIALGVLNGIAWWLISFGVYQALVWLSHVLGR